MQKYRFIVLLLICLLSGAEVDIFTPSFPELQQVFNLSPAGVELMISINFMAYCICSLFAGALADRYNRRTVLNMGLGIFVLGSLCTVCATAYPVLLLGRLLQGIGMASPAILGYIIILEDFPLERQAMALGVLNGFVTLGMAAAPVLGSYVTLTWGWRGNFMILLIMSVISWGAALVTIPSKSGSHTVSLSPMVYLSFFRSRKLMYVILGEGLFSMSYWLFVAMAPILYIEDFGMSLSHFGFYQGAMCGVFGLVSFCTGGIIKHLGVRTCFNGSLVACVISGILLLIASISGTREPNIITGIMLLYSVSVALPCNIAYPISLDLLPNSKGKISAFYNSFRLLLTAVGVEVVGCYYNGSFFPIGITIGTTIICAVFFMYHAKLNISDV